MAPSKAGAFIWPSFNHHKIFKVSRTFSSSTMCRHLLLSVLHSPTFVLRNATGILYLWYVNVAIAIHYRHTPHVQCEGVQMYRESRGLPLAFTLYTTINFLISQAIFLVRLRSTRHEHGYVLLFCCSTHRWCQRTVPYQRMVDWCRNIWREKMPILYSLHVIHPNTSARMCNAEAEVYIHYVVMSMTRYWPKMNAKKMCSLSTHAARTVLRTIREMRFHTAIASIWSMHVYGV